VACCHWCGAVHAFKNKLKNPMHDGDTVQAAAAFRGVDAVFCALGTTRAVSWCFQSNQCLCFEGGKGRWIFAELGT
jgi:hypothetical protein